MSATTSRHEHPTVEPTVELGLDTFGDVTVDAGGRRLSEAEVIRNVVDEAVLADRLGLDFFGVGEHHRDDFATPRPKRCWPPSPQAPNGSAWGPRSRC